MKPASLTLRASHFMPPSLLRLRHTHRIRYSLTAPLGAQRNSRVESKRRSTRAASRKRRTKSASSKASAHGADGARPSSFYATGALVVVDSNGATSHNLVLDRESKRSVRRNQIPLERLRNGQKHHVLQHKGTMF